LTVSRGSYIEKPFWERPFPQVYRCEDCDVYAVMWKPEPWVGHLCRSEPGKANEKLRIVSLGNWELVAEGTEARALIKQFRVEGKL